jgi:hypothetical protein
LCLSGLSTSVDISSGDFMSVRKLVYVVGSALGSWADPYASPYGERVRVSLLVSAAGNKEGTSDCDVSITDEPDDSPALVDSFPPHSVDITGGGLTNEGREDLYAQLPRLQSGTSSSVPSLSSSLP